MEKEVKINSEGRIVIPSEMRKSLNVNDNDVMLIKLNNRMLTVTPKEKRCGICNATENLTENGELIICQTCINKLKQIL